MEVVGAQIYAMETDEIIARLRGGKFTEAAEVIARKVLAERGIEFSTTLESMSAQSRVVTAQEEVLTTEFKSSFGVSALHFFGGFVIAYGLMPVGVFLFGRPISVIEKVMAFFAFAALGLFGIVASLQITRKIVAKGGEVKANLWKAAFSYGLVFAVLRALNYYLFKH